MSNLPHPEPLGIVHGLDIRDYHAGKGISKSGLDDVNHSAAFYRAMRSSTAPAREETDSQLTGNLAHCALLEPAEFDKRYVAGPDVRRNTNEWKAFVAEHPDATPVKPAQRAMALGMADSMRRLQDVHAGLSMAEILSRGRPEVSAYWTDAETGVLCRCRPDWVHPLNKKQVVVVDVKTVGNAMASEFLRQVVKLRYHVQDAMYTDGFSAASGLEVVAFVFVVVEDRWPYVAASYVLDDESRHEGYLQYRQNLDLYAQCLRTNTWPGLASQTTVLRLPAYALTPVEEEITWSEA